MERFTGLLGLVVIIGVAYLFSSNRRAIQPRVLIWGLGLQFAFAFLVLFAFLLFRPHGIFGERIAEKA